MGVHFNWNSNNFITERRIECAKRLLQEPELPISETALRAGFSSQSHFTTSFRGGGGATPRAFRATQSLGRIFGIEPHFLHNLGTMNVHLRIDLGKRPSLRHPFSSGAMIYSVQFAFQKALGHYVGTPRSRVHKDEWTGE